MTKNKLSTSLASSSESKIEFDNGGGKPKGYFRAIVSTSLPNQDNYVIEPFAFKDSLAKKDFSTLKGVRLFFSHKKDQLVGKILSLRYTKEGTSLEMEAALNLESEKGREIYGNMKMEAPVGFSVGFGYNPRKLKRYKGITLIPEAKLLEVSITYNPADLDTAVTACFNADEIVEGMEAVEQNNIEEEKTEVVEESKTVSEEDKAPEANEVTNEVSEEKTEEVTTSEVEEPQIDHMSLVRDDLNELKLSFSKLSELVTKAISELSDKKDSSLVIPIQEKESATDARMLALRESLLKTKEILGGDK